MSDEQRSEIDPALLGISGQDRQRAGETNLGERLTEFLNTGQYVDYLRRQGLGLDDISKLVGVTLEYGVLHPDLQGIDSFLDGIKRTGHFGAVRGFVESIAGKLDVDPESLGGKDAIFSYYYDKVIGDGFYYHGFNGTFEDSIRQHGLDPQMRMWDSDEVRGVYEILAKRGRRFFLGNSGVITEGKINYSLTPSITYQYATGSPEWFAEFAGEAYAQGENNTAFLRRDYPAARQNITEQCDQMQSASQADVQAGRAYPTISMDERGQIMDFFSKYWSIFAGPKSQPAVALIPRSAISGRDLNIPQTFTSFCADYGRDPSELSAEHAIAGIRSRSYDLINESTTQSISPGRLQIARLPAPQRVFAPK